MKQRMSTKSSGKLVKSGMSGISEDDPSKAIRKDSKKKTTKKLMG